MFKNDEEMMAAVQEQLIKCGEGFLKILPKNEPLALDGVTDMIKNRLRQIKGDTNNDVGSHPAG